MPTSPSSPSPSPSPTSPSSNKADLRSNPHPYAIRTTSTGILTRSNSTHSTSSASHHFVPSSPSKPKVNQQQRPAGHRYTRSLTTTELPRPLPVPPKSELDYQPQDASTVPHHNSLSQPNLLLGDTIADELPDDPRVWTPSQLSTYLNSQLRVTSGDLPQIVAQDIATFALTKKITGRKFLRLTGGDLDKYGLNQRWQSVLLAASRSLRKNSLRGRIWDSKDDQDAEQEDLTDESYSSTSSSSSFTGLHRGRPQSTHGRVKGMVASFEGSGPSRSVSPGRRPVKVYSETNTPAISRPRPHSDTFPSRSSYAMSPVSDDPLEETDQKKEKKEPRRLPYPPSPPQVLPEFTSFSMSPQPIHIQGVPTFGPYGSPLPSSQETSFTTFPRDALPFSPQSTGTSILLPENPVNSIVPNSPFAPQQQIFDGPFLSTLTTEGVRPLPLPPHSGQFYQPLVSASVPQVYGGSIDDGTNGLSQSLSLSESRSDSAPPPHAELTESSPPAQVPHVQIQHVPPESIQAHPGIVGTQLVPPHHHHQNIHQRQTQQQFDSTHLSYLQQQPLQNTQILAPQPRHVGRESPTKLLEEKLEELLEPRPRSRVFPGQPSSAHSRVSSTSKEKSHSPAPSRPRSRVPSMNLTGAGGGGSINGRSKLKVDQVANDGTGVGEQKSEGSINIEGNNNASSLGVNLPAGAGAIQHPRTRVISLSSRPHTHRLSGVEAWGESHRHIVVPSGEVKLTTTEEGAVKELEGEEEVGIEALLEKEPPSLSLSVPTPTFEGGDSTIFGHSKESSGGSVGSAGSITHSRSGSLREPKSSVITLVERKPSKLHIEDIPEDKIESVAGSEGGSQAEEESMEALLAKADSSLGGNVKWRGQGGNTKKRMPLSGAEAWETVNVDTVKHVEGDGMNRSIENIFSPIPSSHSATITTPTPHGPRSKQYSPSPQSGKLKLKPKTRKSMDDGGGSGDIEMKTRLDEMERKEERLEKSVDETRKMVEEMKGRLEIVERWIIEKGNKTSEDEDVGKRRRGMWMVLSASRVPGMLGLSAWFGSPSTSSSSSSTSTSRSSSSSSSSNPHQSRTSLIHRIAKMGLSLGTYTVLFGIGICVVLLRALGRWPVVIGRLGEIGTRLRNSMRR